MDKEFKKFVDLSELYEPGVEPGLGPEEDDVMTDLDKLRDVIYSLRDNYSRYKKSDEEDKETYKAIIIKYLELVDKLFKDIREDFLDEKSDTEDNDEDEEEERGTLIIRKLDI